MVRTLGFQLKNGSSILLGSTLIAYAHQHFNCETIRERMVEGLFYLFALGAIVSGIMVISAFSSVHSVL